jgi:gamma-glutamyltranspeptidase/glutathione hydrolase
LVRTRAAALATEELVEEAAASELARSRSAVAAAVAGFFAAAGAHPDVLLAPVTLLVAGVGSGGRVFDGRVRQPGLGARRPRGFVEEAVPAAARVAISTSVAALTVALAYDQRATLTAVARAGTRAASAASAPERARLLERVAEVGPAALAESSFVRPLLHLASPSQGGLLTPADFGAATDVALDARERSTATGIVLEPPWADVKSEAMSAGGARHGLCVVDADGVYAALTYDRIGEGLDVSALGLVAPLVAIPVRRGTPRVAPGTRLPAAAPVAVACDEAGAPLEVMATLQAAPRARKAHLSIARGSGRWLVVTRR